LQIIDRYLLKQFVQIFLICYISLTGLFIVIDVFTNIDHFMTFARAQERGLPQVLGEYYAYRAISIFDKTSGVLVLISAMFTMTWIERYQELTALMAAGVSRWRVLRPVLVLALLLAAGAAANREFFIPQIRQELAREPRNLGGSRAEELVARTDSKTQILIDGNEAVAAEQTIKGANFILPSWLSAYGKQLAAAEAQYLTANGSRPSGYWLKGVTAPTRLVERPSLYSREQPVIVTPRDASWLGEDELFVVSEVPLELLTADANWRQYASTRELVAELKSPSVDLGNDVRVAVHGRLLQPFLDCTLVMLGLPLVVARSNRNPFIAIGMAVGVVALFFAVTLGCQSLGNSGWLRPALAAWMPLLVFGPVAVFLAGSLKR
jgi:lipopolysaccharide export system permease protein